jgi:branched-chain amino acid transport system substrate-binding protein
MKTNTLSKLCTLGACAFSLTAVHADVKIGFTAPLSGPVAAVGQDQYDGFMLGIEVLGKKLGGEAVSVVREDDQLKPELGNQLARKLIDRDKVDAIVGLGFSNVLMASLPRIVETGTVAIATNAGHGRTTVLPKPWASSPRTAATSACT